MKRRMVLSFVLMMLGVACASHPSSKIEKSEPRETPVEVGQVAPDFTLDDQHGQKVTLSAARGQAPVLLVFYRGHW
ncbi:MAG: redoxin domain-containing protein [Blastocatellia bacterium]|nr:redoxin domain-containing protein [Blastocatellia bacterium]